MNTTADNKTLVMQRHEERGAALVLSILSLLLVTILAFALFATGTVSKDISQNSVQQTEAFFISESGLTHGMKLVAAASTSQYTSILQAGDGQPNTGDELGLDQNGINFGSGKYTVYVSDDPAETDGNPAVDTNSRLVIRSVGTGLDGASVTTEAIMAVATAPAILVNGPLLINGNPTVSGTAGTIHSNGALTISGNPCVSQMASSTSTVTIGGSLLGPGCSGSGASQNNAPIIDPPTWNIRSEFYNTGRYDYVLGDDGTVRNRTGALVHNSATMGDDWNLNGVQAGCGGKWTWKGLAERKWVHGGDCLPSNKTWYAAGNMELGSDFGSSLIPTPATFLAEGYITVSAKPIVTRYLEDKYAFMAGTDLTLNGDPILGNSSVGIHYAHHQIKFNGNPKINGVVIAANLADTNSPSCGCNPVPRIAPLPPGRMELSGNAVVTYDGGLISGQARIMSWREVRN